MEKGEARVQEQEGGVSTSTGTVSEYREQLASADKPKLEAEAIQSIQRALNIP